MGEAIHIFSFVFSAINFLILAFVFNKVVVQPMIEAVNLRGERVSSRLKEISQILAEARRTEATYQEQFSRLAAEETELRETNQKEIDRVTSRIKSAAEAEAAHVVAKARREGEKARVEALARVQNKIVVEALVKVETMLKQNLDSEGHNDLNQQVLTKVGKLHAA